MAIEKCFRPHFIGADYLPLRPHYFFCGMLKSAQCYRPTRRETKWNNDDQPYEITCDKALRPERPWSQTSQMTKDGEPNQLRNYRSRTKTDTKPWVQEQGRQTTGKDTRPDYEILFSREI